MNYKKDGEKLIKHSRTWKKVQQNKPKERRRRRRLKAKSKVMRAGKLIKTVALVSKNEKLAHWQEQ